ncbi:MAG: hypothetical protein AVDCRST_MAG93-6268, partial [uncultured Chloroflexia bacterium]
MLTLNSFSKLDKWVLFVFSTIFVALPFNLAEAQSVANSTSRVDELVTGTLFNVFGTWMSVEVAECPEQYNGNDLSVCWTVGNTDFPFSYTLDSVTRAIKGELDVQQVNISGWELGIQLFNPPFGGKTSYHLLFQGFRFNERSYLLTFIPDLRLVAL